jgi:MtN3 and saliva related transmembrane protein
MFWIELIGYIAGFFTLLNILPQIVKTYRTKRAKDLSYLMIITYAISMILWVIYAFLINSLPIIITNGIAFIMSLIQLGLMVKYNRAYND